MDVTSRFEEADAVEALAPERDRCVQGVLEFMAACGVHVSTPPPQLLELLTAYGFHAIGIGRALGSERRTIPPDIADPQPDAPDCEPTRRVLRPSAHDG